MLALGRFALAAASWDTGSGFALMGSARDLTIAVFAEALLLLVIVLAALPAGSTDLVSMSDAAERNPGSGVNPGIGVRPSPSASSCSSRPAVCRSTTPTPTSS